MNPTIRPATKAPSSENGPEQLCADWYAAHGEAIYNYLRFQLVAPDEAEDLTAETFLRAVRSADRFDPSRASAQTWLLTIARNVLIDHIRSVRARRHVGLDELRDLAVDAPSPEERMLRREAVAGVLEAMARAEPGGSRGAEPPVRRRPRHPGDRGAAGRAGGYGADAAVAGARAPAGADEVTGDHSSPGGDPHGAETERLLAGLRFVPRASLGPEIAGRVRRGEVAKGGLGPRRPPLGRWLAAAAVLLVVAPGGRGRLSTRGVAGGARGPVLPQPRRRQRCERRVRGAGARTADRAADAVRGPGRRPTVLRRRPGPAVAGREPEHRR